MFYIRRKSDNIIQYKFDMEPIFKGYMIFPLKAFDVNQETHEVIQIDTEPDMWCGGWYSYDGEWFLTAFGSEQKATKEAQDLFDSIVFDTLSTDTWTIPADGTTHATVTYTDKGTVYFSINETSHAVEPIDYIATLEITADAPGPIRVEVKDKQLIITAIEVQI